MAIVLKTSKDGKRQYRYEQKSVRVAGKVKTPSKYLGAVNPKRKKRDGPGFFAMGGLALAVAGIKGELKPHKERNSNGGRHPRGLAVERERFHEETRKANEEGRLYIPHGAKAHRFKGGEEKPVVTEDQKKEMLDMVKAFSDHIHASPDKEAE